MKESREITFMSDVSNLSKIEINRETVKEQKTIMLNNIETNKANTLEEFQFVECVNTKEEIKKEDDEISVKSLKQRPFYTLTYDQKKQIINGKRPTPHFHR